MVLGEHNYNTYKVNKKLVKEKVSVYDLQLGMYVTELDRPWVETPFLYQGFILSSQDEIDQLIKHCQHVFIDVSQSILLTEAPGTAKSKGKSKSAKRERVRSRRIYKISAEKALPEAIAEYDFAKESVDAVLGALRLSKDIDTAQVKVAVKGCVKSVIKNPNAMLWLTQIKHKDDYTAEHSLRVSVMAVALGVELGLLENELEDLGMGAMLHDVGKVKIPDAILGKEGALTPEEYEVIKTHTTAGKSLLMSKANVPPATIDVAFCHHEQMNGKGYPRGLSAEKIPFYAKIVGVVDAFDAITSDRAYSTGRPTHEALRILYECKGSQFDAEVVTAFIRLIGVYPPGHIVELTSGAVGIVISSDADNKLLPKIILVRNEDKKSCQERIVDLSKNHIDAEGNAIRVKKVYTDGAFGVRLQEYKDKGLRVESEQE